MAKVLRVPLKGSIRAGFALVVNDTGATIPAKTQMSLPEYAKGAKRLLQAIKWRSGTGSHTHNIAYTKGVATTYVPDDSKLAGTPLNVDGTISPPTHTLSASEVPPLGQVLDIVQGQPASGQIQLVGEDKIKLGDDFLANDILFLVLEYPTITLIR